MDILHLLYLLHGYILCLLYLFSVVFHVFTRREVKLVRLLDSGVSLDSNLAI